MEKEHDSRKSERQEPDPMAERIKSSLRNVKIKMTVNGRMVSNLNHAEIDQFLKQKLEEEE